ncbi:hypothetical protein MiSe_51370 [Microseira wollei NIES-4236]|uniref:Uncharacterized protein n=1 Tax=Microseira wollei NIES-4236 TaxID=2530354 RepID=A0AAV3XCS1_9CYAN|nr:hypothetical protein MiSe_51370 [Microseira wollei NIES-4236]
MGRWGDGENLHSNSPGAPFAHLPLDLCLFGQSFSRIIYVKIA